MNRPSICLKGMVALALLVPSALALAPQSANAAPRTPSIRALRLSSGSVSGGATLTILGTNLSSVNAIEFGSAEYQGTGIKVVNSGALKVTTPEHPAGTVNIEVFTRFGRSRIVKADRYRYLGPTSDPPTLDTAVPQVSVGPLPTAFVPSSWSGPNPLSNCSTTVSLTGVVGLDYCGATLEGLAPLPLPSNWSSLTDPQQGFVLMNLERLERNETPIVGISTILDGYASEGATANTDPPVSFITDGVGGSIWASGSFTTFAMMAFLYYDGPGAGDFNLDCTASDNSGCWGHRDNILDGSTNENLAVGVADGSNGDAAAVISDQYADFNFTWAQELAEGYPNGLSTGFELTPVSIAGVTDDGETVSLSGTGLDTGTKVYFSNIADPYALSCSASYDCDVQVPANLAANTTYTIYILNAAGLSSAGPGARYTS